MDGKHTLDGRDTLQAARARGDWEAHGRIWEERRLAEVTGDEAAVARMLDLDERAIDLHAQWTVEGFLP